MFRVALLIATASISRTLSIKASAIDAASVILGEVDLESTTTTIASTLSGHETETHTVSPDNGVCDWVNNAPGGFYTPKQKFRYQNPNDPSSLLGVFAEAPIQKGELLVRVPWDYLLKSPNSDVPMQMDCEMIKEVAKEMRLGNDSDYAPYINYLNNQRDGQLPSDWSEEGQNLLLEILGADDNDAERVQLYPTGSVTWKNIWLEQCDGDLDDKIGWRAAMMALLRADDEIMIPGYDFYNHRNGKWNNAETMTTKNFYHETYAIRDIEAGEQVYISYNQCNQCGGRVEGYGTAELLRDYGFVEVFPQRWHFYGPDTIEFDLDETEDGSLELQWVIQPEGEEAAFITRWMHHQILRLEWLWQIKWNGGNYSHSIPQHEWDVIWQFQRANIVAMRTALQELNSNDSEDPWELVDEMDSEPLQCEPDAFEKYTALDEVAMKWQSLEFTASQDGQDVCLERDEEVHVCSSFRPQYAEYFVHPAASYVGNVQKVLIVGSVTSLLLHEVMKYASLESVVLVQPEYMEVLKVHEHMHASPYFEDSRVEWWFGDPREILSLFGSYTNTFDLVLIDLPGFAMTAFGSGQWYSSLIKDTGVVVIPDYSLEELGEVFQFTTRALYDSPRGCDRSLVLGSQMVDFLHAKMNNHNINTFLFKYSVLEANRLVFFHDFAQRHQASTSNVRSWKASSQHLGVLLLVDIHDVTLPSKDSFEKVKTSLEVQGFNVQSIWTVQNDARVYLFDDGYLISRFYPSESYAALDIHLASGIERLKSLQDALRVALSSSSFSAFRFVTNGMELATLHGSRPDGSIEQDMLPTLPKEVKPEFTQAILETVMKTFFNESSSRVLVVCGEDASECSSIEAIRKINNVTDVYTLNTACPTSESNADELSVVLTCGLTNLERIQEMIVDKRQMVDFIVIDGNLSIHSLEQFLGIVSLEQSLEQWLSKRNVMITMPSPTYGNEYRHSFLQQFHQGARGHSAERIGNAMLGRSVRSKIVIGQGNDTNEFGLVSRDGKGGEQMLSFESKLSERMTALGLHSEIQELRGDWIRQSPRMAAGFHFGQAHYAASESIYQEPSGKQALAQLEGKALFNKLTSYMELALQRMGAKYPFLHQRTDPIEANVVMFEFEGGHVLARKYQEDRVDVNLFIEDEEVTGFSTVEYISELIELSGSAAFALDVFPRGIVEDLEWEIESYADE